MENVYPIWVSQWIENFKSFWKNAPTTIKCSRDLGLHKKPRGFQEMRSILERDYVYISLRSPSWTLHDLNSWWWGGATTCWYDQLPYHTTWVCSGLMDPFVHSAEQKGRGQALSHSSSPYSSLWGWLQSFPQDHVWSTNGKEWRTKPCHEWPAAWFST